MPPTRRNPEKGSLAGAAGDRVRAIIEAAEASAEAIRAEAEVEAERITVKAQERANSLRSEVRADVEALIGSIREGVDRLRADLERLEQRLSEPEGGNTTPVAAPEAEVEPEVALAEDAAVAAAGPDPAMAPSEPDSSPGADFEGARLVALNMALDGASREEIDRHLRDNHGVAEPGSLLDQVYESIGRS
jgi:hypothetical protein